MSLAWLKYLRDEQVESIVKRSNKLRALDLRGSPITNISVDTIMSNLDPSLEELSLSYTNVTFHKLLELKSMPKLRSLNCLHLRSEEIESLKNELPQIYVNQVTKIAAMLSFLPQEGFWDIKSKQVPCGPSNMLYPHGTSGANFPTQQDFASAYSWNPPAKDNQQ